MGWDWGILELGNCKLQIADGMRKNLFCQAAIGNLQLAICNPSIQKKVPE
jgi:hypothetical protein